MHFVMVGSGSKPLRLHRIVFEVKTLSECGFRPVVGGCILVLSLLFALRFVGLHVEMAFDSLISV